MDDKFQNLKVMVIDDSKTIRRTAETLLQREGCEVVTAVDGFEALSKIAEANPDIVFVDIMIDWCGAQSAPIGPGYTEP